MVFLKSHKFGFQSLCVPVIKQLIYLYIARYKVYSKMLIKFKKYLIQLWYIKKKSGLYTIMLPIN